MEETPLLIETNPSWLQAVLRDFDSFLQDHAAAEKKASGMAISMLSHYPDRILLVTKMADLAIEELTHYREVLRWIHSRGLVTAPDTKDLYVLGLRQVIRKETDTYLLDRLLTASVIEARGAERFSLIADAIEIPPLKNFYQSLAKSEARHYRLFLDLAKEYFDSSVIELRWNQILNIEAKVVSELPIRAALH
ncbi:MAG: tRNA-(ms[2]io[6]A)-hydroxylase [Halieaceae bacterium]|nr:tRNA-(ms[2]io[6]A)-hydroxylase [Halieaceae bacterium]